MRNSIYKYFQGDKVIWIVIFILFVTSLLAVYSSTGTLAYKFKEGNTLYYLFRHLKFLLVGLFVIFIMHRIPYQFFSKLAPIFYVIAIVLLLVTLLLGVSHNEATRWLTLPGLGIEFQVSDFAKFALIVFVAKQLAQYQDNTEELNREFKTLMGATIIICALILPENFSTSILLFVTATILFFIGRVNIKMLANWVFVLSLIGILGLVIAFNSPQLGRVGTWKSRIESYVGSENQDNYQADMAKIAISTGGFTGKGPGQSTQRNFLPQPYSDFIYAIIVEEYGFAGGFFILVLYLYLFYRTGVIVNKANKTFQAFLAVGLALSLVIQALTNMAVAVNLLPVTGQTLPLVSMGGTSILFSSVALGIILSISRDVAGEHKIVQKRK